MVMQEAIYLLPELIILGGAMVLLLLSAFMREDSTRFINTIVIIVLCVSLAVVVISNPSEDLLVCKQLIFDNFARFAKLMLLSLGVLWFFATRDFLQKDEIEIPEYSVLILLAILGMMIMVSAQSFLSLFMGLELQSLSLYILTAIRHDDNKCTEAGIKYFLLGSLATGIMLYGMSFIYGVVGNIGFSEVKDFLNTEVTIPTGFYLGMVFIICGTVFKISVAPFHMWAPDVYEGAPTSVVSFFASVAKMAAFCMIIRLLADPFLALYSIWQYIIATLAVLTMVIGVFGALYQKNIKRLLAYSAIMNMGYGLLGLLAGNDLGIQASLVYIVLYSISSLGFFICLLLINIQGQEIVEITDLAGLFRLYPTVAFTMVFLLFSMAGIPPTAGFLGKLYVFKAALQGGMLIVPLVGILVSVIAAGYYLYVIKVIIMDDPAPKNLNLVRGRVETTTQDGAIQTVYLIIALLIWFFMKPDSFLKLVFKATNGLFPL